MVVSKISSNIHAFHPILTQYSFFSGRYADFARQLTVCNFGVYAMDWIGNLIFIMYTFEILILHIIICLWPVWSYLFYCYRSWR